MHWPYSRICRLISELAAERTAAAPRAFGGWQVDDYEGSVAGLGCRLPDKRPAMLGRKFPIHPGRIVSLTERAKPADTLPLRRSCPSEFRRPGTGSQSRFRHPFLNGEDEHLLPHVSGTCMEYRRGEEPVRRFKLKPTEGGLSRGHEPNLVSTLAVGEGGLAGVVDR